VELQRVLHRVLHRHHRDGEHKCRRTERNAFLFVGYLNNPTDISDRLCRTTSESVSNDKNRTDPICENCVT
jgi:hypothetical protein